MNRIVLAFRSFFAILFGGELPVDVAKELGFERPQPPAAPPKPVPQIGPGEGALQMIGILQRDARLVDFLMEDITAYEDDQVGAAVRNLHDQCRDSLIRYVRLSPVIDGVEGSFIKTDGSDPSSVKLLGNVPANGKVPGGMLRHKGWRAENVNLPPLPGGQSALVIAPAEIEVE